MRKGDLVKWTGDGPDSEELIGLIVWIGDRGKIQVWWPNMAGLYWEQKHHIEVINEGG